MIGLLAVAFAALLACPHAGAVPIANAGATSNSLTPHQGGQRIVPDPCVPRDFVFGAASAAYQIEGGVRDGGRSPSTWDAFSHIPGKIADNTTGDTACDSFHRWDEDIDALGRLNARSYRLSLSWSRIMRPDGSVNKPGVAYYKALLTELVRANIEPIVTLFHWDLPLWHDNPENYPRAAARASDAADIRPAGAPADADTRAWFAGALATRASYAEQMAVALAEEPSPAARTLLARVAAATVPAALADSKEPMNGWLDARIVPLFVRYAQVVMSELGPLTRLWGTMNEPSTVCVVGYSDGVHSPGRCSNRTRCFHGDSTTEPYLCAHYMTLSHAYAKLAFDKLHRNVPPSVARAGRAGLRTGPAQMGLFLASDFNFPISSADIMNTRTKVNPLPLLTPEQLADAPAAERAAAQRVTEFQLGWYADPLYFGDYPQSMRARVGRRLPQFTPQQRADMLSAPPDFLGVNQYTSRYVSPDEDCEAAVRARTAADTDSEGLGLAGYGAAPPAVEFSAVAATRANAPLLGNDMCAFTHISDRAGRLIGPRADSEWLYSVPTGLPLLLDWATRRYSRAHARLHAGGVRGTAGLGLLSSGGVGSVRGKLPLMVTENGCDEPGSSQPGRPDSYYLNDGFRLAYYQNYTDALFDGVRRYGLNLSAYYAWSLVDNFEWAAGMSHKFGLHYLQPGTLDRLPKYSVKWLARVYADPSSHWPFCEAAGDASGVVAGAAGGNA